MADQDRPQGQDNQSPLTQQSGGEGQPANFTEEQGATSQGASEVNPYSQGPEPTGTFKPDLGGGQDQQNAPMGVGQGSFQATDAGAQQTFAQQGEVDQQRMGATSDQLGQNRQGYGGSTRQDASGGLGDQPVVQGAQGQTGVLGPQPGQSQGQPGSPTTGGPSLAQGLSDDNSR